MIGALQGKVAAITPESIIVDVSGVGYELTVTSAVLERISGLGSDLSLSVYTDVKENSITLYGFDQPAEKGVFLMLRKVKGIGSKTAIAVLSAIGSEGVLRSIGSGDLDALQAISGIGKKTAARLVVELREQVTELIQCGGLGSADRNRSGSAGLANAGRRPAAPSARSGLNGLIAEERTTAGDVIMALEKLGFSRDRARQALDACGQSPEAADPGELLKLALLNI